MTFRSTIGDAFGGVKPHPTYVRTKREPSDRPPFVGWGFTPPEPRHD